jgi:hypothetical protein
MRKLLFILLATTAACSARSSHSTIPTVYGAAGIGDDAIVARYLQGESLDQLAGELKLDDRDEARGAVHRAMQSLQKRYYADR